jgi:hypothetical protein
VCVPQVCALATYRGAHPTGQEVTGVVIAWKNNRSDADAIVEAQWPASEVKAWRDQLDANRQRRL